MPRVLLAAQRSVAYVAGALFALAPAALAVPIPLSDAATTSIPTVPGDGITVEVFLGTGGGVPTPARLATDTPEGSLRSPRVDFPSPGATVPVSQGFSVFFANTTVAPDAVAALPASSFILRHTAFLKVTRNLDRFPGTTPIDIQIGCGTDDGHYLMVGNQFLGQGGDRGFAYSWYTLEFEDEGLYPLYYLFSANAVGFSGEELAWNVASGQVILPQDALYTTLPGCSTFVNFEEYPVGTVPTGEYATQGATFNVLSGQVQITNARPTEFVPVSAPNVLADPRINPPEAGIVEISFVQPGTSIPGATNFFSCYVIDAETTGATLTGFDIDGVQVFTQTFNAGGAEQELAEFPVNGIHRVVATLGSGADTSALDNVCFAPPVRAVYPDLVVTDITPPPAGLIGSAAAASWTVSNNGAWPAFASWADRVYISPDATFGNGNDTLVATVTRSADLPDGDSYVATANFNLPTTAGQYWITVQTDWAGAVNENNAEGNNVTVAAAATTVQAPDLVVFSVTPPTSAFDGEPANIAWTTRNAGDGLARFPWADRAYLSLDNVFDAGDTLLGQVVQGVDLPAGSDAPQGANVTIPAGLSGAFFIIVVTDATNVVNESGAEGNNATAAPITIVQRQYPDLEVTQLTPSGGPYTGQRFDLAWRVGNTGAGTANGTWRDKVYLSTDAALDPQTDALLKTETIVAQINPGGAYLRTVSFDLPMIAGNYTLFVVVDAEGAVTEEDDANNTTPLALSVLAPEYTAEVVADVDSAPRGTPVLLSGDATRISDGLPAANVPVDIRLAVRGTTRTLRAITNVEGRFEFTFNPLGEEAGVYRVSADHPALFDAQPEDQFTLYGLATTAGSISLDLVANAPQNGQFQVRNLGDTPLTNLTFQVTGLPPSIVLQIVGAGSLPPLATATFNYTAIALDVSTASATPTVNFSTAEGASASLGFQISVRSPTPQLATTPTALASTMLRGEQTFVQFDARNVGGAPTSLVSVQLPPGAPWLTLSSPSPLGPLASGETAAVVLTLAPAADLPLGRYTGSIVLSDGQTGVAVPFTFDAVSNATGDLRVEVTDEFSYYAPGLPRVAGAVVVVKNATTDAVVASGVTDQSGVLLFQGLTEAYYKVEARADNHGAFNSTVLVSGMQERRVEAFLPRQVVNYSWSVTPTTVNDEYRVQIEAVFETNVPTPVVTIDPPLVDLTDFTAPTKQVDFTITNHGLISALAARLQFDGGGRYIFRPLVEQFGDLPAQTSIVVPVVIEDTQFGSGLGGGPCIAVSFELAYDLICGIRITYVRPVFFRIPNTNCPGAGGPGGTIVGGCCGGPGGPVVINPSYTQPTPCDPCAARCALSLLDCAIRFTPWREVRCIWSLSRNCGLIGDPNALKCGWSLFKCIVKLHPAVKFIECGLGIYDNCNCLLGGGGGPGGSEQFFTPIDIDTGDPLLAYYAERYNRQVAVLEYYAYVFGDAKWLDVQSESESDLAEAWITQLELLTDDASESGLTISATERAALLALPLHPQLTPADVTLFLDRWNQTVDYYGQGIYTASQVPPGGSLNFVDRDVAQPKLDAAYAAMDADLAENTDAFLTSARGGFDLLRDDRLEESEGVCARVTIQINQQAVVARSAFEARLVLENNGDTTPLDNVLVEVIIEDEEGLPADVRFGVLPPNISGGLTQVDGTQSLQPTDAATATWIIVPRDEAAPTTPTTYFVRGRLSYVLDGVLTEIPLYPVEITVVPNPKLKLDYFLEKVVYSDDPFTAPIEPATPFSLGLLVTNIGAGETQNLRITSAQPEIVENDRGLLINFTIIGTQVGLEQFSPSLTTNFGDVQPGQTKLARWLLLSTLQGEFVAYSATYEQVGPLGELGLSIIDSVNIFEMNHVVRVDRPGDDGLPDFLTNDTPDGDDLPDTIHTSQNTLLPVAGVLDGLIDGPITPSDFRVDVSATLAAGWNYIRIDDPGAAQYPLRRVVRSDGREVRLIDNAWLTSRIRRPQGQPEEPLRYLHIVDFADAPGLHIYNVFYAPPVPITGDSNCDGVIDFGDIDPFLLALFDPAGFAAAYPGCDRVDAADFTGDGVVDFFDIDPFVACLFGACP